MIKRYNIKVDGKSYEVEVEELVGDSNAALRPEAVSQSAPKVSVHKACAPKPQVAPSGGSGSVLAPMPGTINDIKVKSGDTVKKGQVLLILEAMKMENEIMASCDGTVSSVNVSKGASVSAGDVLVIIA